jgi:hypothetical protein
MKNACKGKKFRVIGIQNFHLFNEGARRIEEMMKV